MAVEIKRLYNLETNTLVSLYPKSMTVEVRQSFLQTYHVEEARFALLYLLFLSHPRILKYMSIIKVLKAYGIKIHSTKELKSLVNSLKYLLSSLGAKNLIISVKGIGYGISNKWVEPDEIENKGFQDKLVKYFKKLGITLARDNVSS